MAEQPDQTEGRERNAALPLGQRGGGDTDAKARAAGKREQGTAGPDGPDARVVGDTFKQRR